MISLPSPLGRSAALFVGSGRGSRPCELGTRSYAPGGAAVFTVARPMGWTESTPWSRLSVGRGAGGAHGVRGRGCEAEPVTSRHRHRDRGRKDLGLGAPVRGT